jgi:hypothetical protein
MQPGLIALNVGVGVPGSTVSLYRVPTAPGFAIVLHQENFSVEWGRYIALKCTETAVGNSRLHRAAFDVSHEHVTGDGEVFRRYLDPVFRIGIFLLPAELSCGSFKGRKGEDQYRNGMAEGARMLLNFSQMGTPNESEDAMADKESMAQRVSNCVTTASASMDAALPTPDAPIHFARGARVRLRDPDILESHRTGTVIGILPGDDTRLRVRWDGLTGLRTVVEARLKPSEA